MRTLGVIDLKQTASDATGWRELRSATMRSEQTVPVGALITPAGFGFVELPEGASWTGLRVEILRPKDLRVGEPRDSAITAPSNGGRILPTVMLRPDGNRARSCVPRSGLILEVAPDLARIQVDDQAWELVSAPVLLAISQCWRFSELDRRLDELCTWARETSTRRGTVGRLESFQQLLLELPSFEGPLTDPRGYFATIREARLYRSLARALGLPTWRAFSDERIEAVEAALSHLAEERRLRVSMTAALVLEVLILVVLLADLTLNIWQTFVAE